MGTQGMKHLGCYLRRFINLKEIKMNGCEMSDSMIV